MHSALSCWTEQLTRWTDNTGLPLSLLSRLPSSLPSSLHGQVTFIVAPTFSEKVFSRLHIHDLSRRGKSHEDRNILLFAKEKKSAMINNRLKVVLLGDGNISELYISDGVQHCKNWNFLSCLNFISTKKCKSTFNTQKQEHGYLVCPSF